jgi:hypothetical protein
LPHYRRGGSKRREHRSARREPGLDEAAGELGLALEEADADGKDLVEAAVAEIEVLEPCDEELGPARLDVRRVAARRGSDHLRRAVDGSQPPAVEPLADERRRYPWPQPISRTRSSGRTSSRSTIRRSRSLMSA